MIDWAELTEKEDGDSQYYNWLGQIDFWVRNALNKDYASFYFESMGNGFMQKGRPVQAGIELRCRESAGMR